MDQIFYFILLENKIVMSFDLVAVMFAYEQCLLVLGHHPDIWYEAAQYLEQSSKLLAEKGVGDLSFKVPKKGEFLSLKSGFNCPITLGFSFFFFSLLRT